MKHLFTFKWLTAFALIPFMWTLTYGDTVAQLDPLKIVGSSKYYGQMTKTQAAEIIEICAKETYGAKALVEENGFFMGVSPQSYPDSSGKRTTTNFKWTKVTQIEVLQGAIIISYESSFFMIKQNKSLKLSGKTYGLADLALAAYTLTGLPLSPEKPVQKASDPASLKNPPVIGGQSEVSGQAPGSAQGAKNQPSGPDLEERLLKLKGLYDKGLISKAVYESKQKELLDTMLNGK